MLFGSFFMIIDLNSDILKFKENFLYQKPYLFKCGFKNINIDWAYINEVYSRANVAHQNFKLMNGYEVPKSEYIESYSNIGVIEHRCIRSVLYEYLRNGATLVHNRIKNEPLIDHISKQIANFAEAPTITSGYAAFSSKSSYKSHWDTRDVYAVQLLGRKRWILKKPNFEFPLYMQQTKHFPDIQEPEEVYMDVILEAGDVLYIPRGWWHNPLPLDGETFHLAIGTFAPTGFEYIQWLQNVVPNLLDCRKNLTNFEDDEEIITNISEKIAEIIKDRKHYQNFMMNYLGEQRVPSMLSLDVLGNGRVSEFDANQKLSLNANLLYFFQEDFVIINGNKINVDEVSLKLIKYLFDHQCSTVATVLAEFETYPSQKINDLLFKLAIEDVIELVNIDL